MYTKYSLKKRARYTKYYLFNKKIMVIELIFTTPLLFIEDIDHMTTEFIFLSIFVLMSQRNIQM